MNVPDYMPILSHGAHPSPESGACFMEMIAFLNGEDHTDKPSCVHRNLIPVGINANDFLSDENRQRMVPFMTAFMGTADIDLDMVKARVQQEVFPEFYNWFQGSDAKRYFQRLVTCFAKDFNLTAVIRQIANEYGFGGLTAEAADEAVLEYVEAVAKILTDIKGATPVDMTEVIKHPAVKANV
jgi:hypothetical protein